jgi:mono/diheme cytochrome c family protein
MHRSIVLFALLVGCGKDYVADDDTTPDAAPGNGLRFYEDVSPILMKHCVACHQPGGAGPFPLISLGDVIAAAPSIPGDVMSRRMPPYGADDSGSCNTFENARWLSDAEISTIVTWLAGDRAPGDPAAAPAVPPPPPPLARVDATAKMVDAYLPDPQMPDDYRCFIVDPGLAADTYLTGFEVRPGVPAEVHHILVFQLADANAETTAANLDAQSAGPGYTCFGGVGASANLVGVWAPGMRVASYPDGTGLALKGGRKMVLQVHYHPHGAPQPDTTAVDMMLASTVANPSFLYLVADPNLYLPPQMPSVAVVNQVQLPSFLPQYNVWGVFPHMHTLGRQLRVEVDHAGRTQCMIDVPRWDFNWQQGYFYDTAPKIAGGGDTVRISCTYDTSSRTTPVMWGEGTEDEMCLAFIYVSQY